MARVRITKAAKEAPRKDTIKPRAIGKNASKTSNANEGAKRAKKNTNSDGRDVSVSKSKFSEDFKQEVFALGGNEEDLKLLEDIDSDADVNESVGKADPMLSKDVKHMIKELGITSVNPESDAESEGEEESSGSDEDDESGTSEEEAVIETGEQAAGQAQSNVNDQVAAQIKGMNTASRTLIEPSPSWHTLLPPFQHSGNDVLAPASPKYQKLLERAQSLHEEDCATFSSTAHPSKLTASSSDAAFLQRVLTSGTLSDKLSALTLLVQSSPVHNVKALETLKGMSGKKGREESLKALRAMVDWWVGGGAPDRKLRHFVDQPLGHKDVTDTHLVLWYFEDWLKKYFFSILQTLERLSLDPLPYVRLQSMNLILNLLRGKPEQEHNLLRLLVNKLGDSEKSVASRASFQLLQLLQAHPHMKAVVVREITSLILRPSASSAPAQPSQHPSGRTHIKFMDDTPAPSTSKSKPPPAAQKKTAQKDHAKYYAAITCNQIMLSPGERDREVARQLVKVYFELFKEVLERDGEGSNEKRGVKGKGRAGSELGEDENEGGDTKTRGKGKRGNEKKHEGDAGFAEVEDSTSKLISAVLTGVNRALPFAKLGLEDVEFNGYIDTLFLITHTSTFNVSLQALRLILQISITLSAVPSSTSASSSPAISTASITDRYYRSLYASLLDPRLNATNKRAMYLNLLFKSLREDKDLRKTGRKKAFVKRFLQLLVGAGDGGAEFVAGGLYLLGELFSTEADLHDLCGPEPSTPRSQDEHYDPKARDPQYAHASSTSLWELIPLLSHYHPTINLHASQLLTSRPITGSADLSLNTLSHFLDRFVHKTPKKPKPKGASAMQPGVGAGGLDGTEVRLMKGAGGDVVDKSIAVKKVGDVPVDQVFFHKYFSVKEDKERARAGKAAKRKGATSDSEADKDEGHVGAAEGEEASAAGDGTDSEDEAEIWAAMKATNPVMKDVSSDEDEDEDEDISLHSGGSSGDEFPSAETHTSEEDVDEGDDLSLAEKSDAEELIDFDEGTDNASDEEEEEWGGVGGGDSKKRQRRSSGADEKRKRKKLRSLPTFASYEDYAKMIEDEPEDNI